jgi:group I intron endonuclease
MLQRSWNKHGEDSFVFEVLEIIHAADLVEREKYWISALCTTRDFNVCPAAGSPRGLKRSPEFSAKQSARRGEKRPPVSVEHRAKIALSKIGRKASDETKAKMSAKRLGKKREPFTEEHKANISAARVGMECPWVSISNAKRAKHAASDS